MNNIYQIKSVSEELGINPEACGLNELKNLIFEIRRRRNHLITAFPVSRFSQEAMQSRQEELVNCERILARRFC